MAGIETRPLSPLNPLTTITEQDRATIYSRVTDELNYLLNGPGSFYADGVQRNQEDLLDSLRGLMGDIQELQSVVNDPSNILGSVRNDLLPIINGLTSSLENYKTPDNIEMKPEYAPNTNDDNVKYVNPNIKPNESSPNPLEPKNWNKYQDTSLSSSEQLNLAGQVPQAANVINSANQMVAGRRLRNNTRSVDGGAFTVGTPAFNDYGLAGGQVTSNTPSQIGNGSGGVWTTTQQPLRGQAGQIQLAVAPTDHVAGPFPDNGAPPIGTLNGANQTRTFDPAASGVPLPRLRPPHAPAASWPSAPVAPLPQMPQTGAAAPEHPDWHDAIDWPQQGLPSWTQTQPSTENTFPASPNGVRGLAGAQPLAPQRMAPQPALPVQNLTTHVLRMKGVPEADIAAAINDPRTMQDLLNQLYGRRSMIAPGDDSGRFGNGADRSTPADQPAQALTPAAIAPENYLPFGWSGLQALLR
jgi:hypothetical protein